MSEISVQRALQLFESGDYAGAKPILESLSKSADVEPQVQSRLAFIYIQQGDFVTAESILRRVEHVAKSDVQSLYWLAVSVAQQGRLTEAKALYESVLEAAPQMPEAHNDLGHVLRGLGDARAAESHFRAAVDINPRLLGPLYNLGLGCAQQGRYEEAEAWYRRAIEVDGAHFQTLNNLANVLRQTDRMNEALEYYRKALNVRPDAGFVHANLAHSLENLHRLDEALEHARKALEYEPMNPVASLVAAQVNRRQGKLKEAAACIEALSRVELPVQQSAAINAELGHIHDRMGAFQQAFSAWSRSNQAWVHALGPERSQDPAYPEYVADVGRYFDTVENLSWPTSFPESHVEAPFMLAGFPRSGTTLMEAMLCAHSEVSSSREAPILGRLISALSETLGAGVEYPRLLDAMDDASCLAARSRYEEIRRKNVPASDGFRHFLEKLPLNIVELGMVRRVFPDAKIVVMLRDPRDACLSAFAQAFQPNRAMALFLTVEGAARLYAQVMDLWLQYRRDLGLEFIEVRYEDLVARPESTMRDTLSFLGCDWQAQVLDYHEVAGRTYARTPSYQDVTAPVYDRSIGRWKQYQEMLEPAMPMLDKYVKEFGYADPE